MKTTWNYLRGAFAKTDPPNLSGRYPEPRASDQNPFDFPLYWLFNRDPILGRDDDEVERPNTSIDDEFDQKPSEQH